MGSVSITELIGAYNIRDFGAANDGNHDASTAIRRALAYVASLPTPNGIIFVPPGTYRIDTPVEVPSSVTLEGAGEASVLKLGPSKYDDVLVGDGTSNFRIRNLKIDGNRANNTAGTRQGIWLSNVSDAWLENVVVVSCRRDGFRLDDCRRVELRGCKASDNGRHGFSISYSEFCIVDSPRAYDNCQVSDAGDGDGINLELLTGYTTIKAALCYETAGVGDRQGYPIREASGEGCHHNVILGGAGWGNRTSNLPSLDSGDSICLWPGKVSFPLGITITP